MHQFFAGVPKGLEALLVTELTELGAEVTKQTLAGVHFQASWATAYDVLLFSRLASRVLHPLKRFPCTGPDALYQSVRSVPWAEHFDIDASFVVDAHVSRSVVNHERFAAQRVKDGVVDAFRQRYNRRPSVDREQPDLRINLNLREDQAVLSIDLGGPLHARGYAPARGKAPLRENLAAALLIRAGWPEIAKEGGALIDPMCGSGTLLAEGLLMAADIAPGLLRDRMPLFSWLHFDHELWQERLGLAEQRRTEGLAAIDKLAVAGFDRDEAVLEHARANLERAGLAERVQLGKRDLAHWKPANTRGWQAGLVVTNPPYGERLGELSELPALYATLGRTLLQSFKGWRATVFTGNPDMGKRMGLRATKVYKFYNGTLACDLLNFQVEETYAVKHGGEPESKQKVSAFRNRLAKNFKTMRKWAEREGVTAYRIYDGDIPEYNVAVDVFGEVAVVSEYAPPKAIDPKKAENRLQDLLGEVPEVLGIPADRVALKHRRRRKDGDRYDRLEKRGEFIEVKEYVNTFLINPWDYLDVGLFNDHRPVRSRIFMEAGGRRFLNLFGYTGTASVAAAAGGAKTTTTVDLSYTYLDWAEQNMARNGYKKGPAHRFIKADCMEWLKQSHDRFDLIFLDPPTFSNSKSFEGSFDVQRDHVTLITRAARLLARGGLLLFSNNFRRFSLDKEQLELAGLEIRDITEETIPEDYKRNPKIHVCFEIRRR